jgi:hypothetical protein
VPGRDRTFRGVAACAAVVVLALAGCGDDGDALAERQAEVADRGADVMPFDLDATTHTFTDTDDGGIQTVTADDPADVDQIQLVRDHLREERDKFARGHFEDPAAIHGHDMDGVAELAAGYRDITVTYTDLPDGGRLTYTTDRPALVDAVHAWFARQVTDHGAHAETG